MEPTRNLEPPEPEPYSKGKKGTLGTRVGWVFVGEKLSTGKQGGEARSVSALNLTPTRLHPTSAPEREEKSSPLAQL